MKLLIWLQATEFSYDDVIKWKHFPSYWPFVRGIHRSGEIPAQRPVTRSFDVFFDLRLIKRLSKQLKHRWFETPLRSLWCHCNENTVYLCILAVVWLLAVHSFVTTIHLTVLVSLDLQTAKFVISGDHTLFHFISIHQCQPTIRWMAVVTYGPIFSNGIVNTAD